MSENTTMLKELYTTVTTEDPTDQQLDMLNTAFHNLHVRDALILQAMRHDIPFDLFTAMAEHPRQMESAVGSIMDAMVNGGRYAEAHARGFLTLLGRMADRPSANAQTYAVTAYLHWFLHDDAGETMDSLLKALQMDSDCLMAQIVYVGMTRGIHPSQPKL